MSVARVDLMASAAGKIGGVTWHHLFLVAADDSGRQWFLRAGPEHLPLEKLAGRKSELGDPLKEYEPAAEGPYGAIAFASGVYAPGGADFDPAAANATLASAAAAARLWDEVSAAAKALGEERIAYDPIGKGANWAIMEALRRCGVQASLPPRRWAPGAGDASYATPTVATRRVGQAVVVA
jgi:hypothetical protein